MSRIGKKPIELPAKVSVKIAADGAVNVEGPKGKLAWKLPAGVTGKVDGTKVSFAITSDHNKALFGLSRSLVNNMVKGVAEGYVKDLEIQGVGFKAAVQGKVVNLLLGYSHAINYPIPDQIKVTVEENTKLTIEGPDKQIVGKVAAEIRGFYPPEPYKGKGVRYAGVPIKLKPGKTGK